MYHTDKMKEILNIEDDLKLQELFDIIYEYRNSQHPDKFVDEEIKKIVNEKFIEADNALLEIKNEINRLLKNDLSKSNNSLELYGKYVGNLSEKFEIIELQKNINLLKNEVDNYKAIIKNVHKSEKKEIKEKLNNENIKISSKLTLNKKEKGLFGGVITLTGLILLIQQVEFFKKFLIAESFIDTLVLKYAITSCVVLLLLWIILKVYSEKTYIKIINHTQTSEFRTMFYDYCKNKNCQITDNTIVNFIKEQLEKEKVLVFLCEKIYFIKTGYLAEILKDNFIYWLLQKKYLKYSTTVHGNHKYEFINYENTWSTNSLDDLDKLFWDDEELKI